MNQMMSSASASDLADLRQQLLRAPQKQQSWHALAAAGQHALLGHGIYDWLERCEELPRQGLAAWFRATFLTQGPRPCAALAEAISLAEDLPDQGDCPSVALQFLLPRVLLNKAESQSRAAQLLDEWAWAQQLEAFGRRDRRTPTTSVKSCDPEETLQRVAIVAPMLGQRIQTQTQLVYGHARLLAEANLKIGIFSTQENRSAQLAQLTGLPLQDQVRLPDLQQWLDVLRPGSMLWCADPNQHISLRRAEFQERLEAFAPQVLLSIGLPSPLPTLVGNDYPLVSLPSIGLPPVGPADVWLCSRPDSQRARHQKTALSIAYAHRSMDQIRPVMARTRDSLGLHGKQLLMISVGVRLDQEVSGEWAAHMLQLLRDQPKACWLLVGSQRPSGFETAGDQLRLLPTMPNRQLSETLAAADVYVNPPRLGGGLSVAQAMACGLPVLSGPDCDGADKLGPWVQQDLQAYFALLRELLADPKARRRLGDRMKEHHHRSIAIESGGPALLQALNLARQRFSQRKAAAGPF